jgi:hypothetical protein
MREVNYTERMVTARKRHRCEEYGQWPCWIEHGQRYLRAVAFPGHDALGNGTRPWVIKLCLAHAGRAEEAGDA